MLGLVIASLVRLAETRLGEAMVRSPWLDNFSGVFASYLATVLLIGCVALVFYFIPNTKVRFRDVWPGAILVGVLWRIALRLFSWYAADLATWNVIHGSIAAVVVFLLWIYVERRDPALRRRDDGELRAPAGSGDPAHDAEQGTAGSQV